MSLIEDMVVLVIARSIAEGSDNREQVSIAQSLVRNSVTALEKVGGAEIAAETAAIQAGRMQDRVRRIPSGGRCRK